MVYAPVEQQMKDLRLEEMNEVHTWSLSDGINSNWKIWVQLSSQALTKKIFFFQLQSERIIYDHFSNSIFINQLIEFLSLEDRKGKDKFNPRRFCLFKVQAQIPNCKVCLVFYFTIGQS